VDAAQTGKGMKRKRIATRQMEDTMRERVVLAADAMMSV